MYGKYCYRQRGTVAVSPVPHQSKVGKQRQRIDVFISSPNDVQRERKIAVEVVNQFNNHPPFNDHFSFHALAYEEIVPSMIGEHPQAVVDRYMRAGEADIFIGILWSRMGTPFVDEKTGQQFTSGTDYEFKAAYEAYQQRKQPHISFYRCKKLVSPDVDSEQLGRVQDFFRSFAEKQGKFQGYYKLYSNDDEFKTMLRHDLEMILSDYLKTLPGMSTEPTAQTLRSIDWSEAPSIKQFYGREPEQRRLRQWIVEEQSRMVAILGMGGIGKSALASEVARHIESEFEYGFWHSLQNAPKLNTLLKIWVLKISQKDKELPPTLDEQIAMLLTYLRMHRCLIVLDNAEAIMQSGQYREGYEEYGLLFARIGEAAHKSCLLLTSRENPAEVERFEGKESSVHMLRLRDIEADAAAKILSNKGVSGTETEHVALLKRCMGNPLILLLTASRIANLYEGNISTFLTQEDKDIPERVYAFLDKQFMRLSSLEQDIMYWLAIEREPTSLQVLHENLLGHVRKREVLHALESLLQHSLVEGSVTHGLTIQPVIMEYVTEKLIGQINQELKTGTNRRVFDSHALIKAQARDYVRESQMRMILKPIADHLFANIGRDGSEQKLRHILTTLQAMPAPPANYAAGNILNLLVQLQINLNNYDFSRLTMWQAYLAGVALPSVDFSHADLSRSVFSETFENVFCVAFSPDGQTLAAGTAGGEIWTWQVSSGMPQRTYSRHTDWVRSIAFSPNGKLLTSGSDDYTIKIWDVSTGQCIHTLREHSHFVSSIAFSPDGNIIASGSYDRTLRVWDVASGRCLKTLHSYESDVRSVAFSPDGILLASGHSDHIIRIWEVSSEQCVKTLQGHQGWVPSVVFSPDGALLASGSADKTIRIWKVTTGDCDTILHGHTHWIRSVAFSPDGSVLASTGLDQTIRLWAVDTGQLLHTLCGDAHRLWSVAFSPDGMLLATGSEDPMVQLWQVSTGQCIKTLRGYTDWVYAVAFSPDGYTLVSGCEDSTILLWGTDSKQYVRSLQGHHHRVQALAFSPNGQILASGSVDHTIRFWDMHTYQCLRTLEGPSWIYALAFSPDGTILAGGVSTPAIWLWDVHTGQRLKTLADHTGSVRAVAFSPNSTGMILASGGEDKIVRLWNVETSECIWTSPGHTNWIQTIAFSPDGNIVASGSHDQTIRLWNARTGSCLKVLQGHTNKVIALAFSSDGSILASSSEDQTIRLWNVHTGENLHTLAGHTNMIRAVAFHPRLQRLVSGSHDGTLKLWDALTGVCLDTLRRTKPYEGMNITGVKGLTEIQIIMLSTLGAVANKA